MTQETISGAAERLNEIKERLRLATPGPWRTARAWRGERAFGPNPDTMYEWSAAEGVMVVGRARAEDAEFLANAPADIAYLLERLTYDDPEASR